MSDDELIAAYKDASSREVLFGNAQMTRKIIK